MGNTIYEYRVFNNKGTEVSLEAYKGKVLLIVNTASECGFTSQFDDLIKLKEFFEDENFEILAFPSNDFGSQEPLNDLEIAEFCSVKFNVNFPIFSKIKVRGEHRHPLYSFLSDKKKNGNVNVSPKWNFQKYLIDTNGEVVDYYLPFTKPNSSKIRKKIKKLMLEQIIMTGSNREEELEIKK